MQQHMVQGAALCKNQGAPAHPMKLEYTTDEYLAELQRQSTQAQALVSGLDRTALNWRPDASSWSVAQCIAHLAGTNEFYLAAIRDAIERNEDQIEPGRGVFRPAGWPSRYFITQVLEPPPKQRFRAFKRIIPAVALYQAGVLLGHFLDVQQEVAVFVRRCGDMDLGTIRFPNPFLKGIHFTVATGLLIIGAHNRRHLWQAGRVKECAGFPS